MFVVGIDCHCHHRHRHHSPIIGSLGNDGNEKKMMAMKKKKTAMKKKNDRDNVNQKIDFKFYLP